MYLHTCSRIQPAYHKNDGVTGNYWYCQTRTDVVAGLSSAVPAGAVHVASVRAGHEAGEHTVGFDGPHDEITLRHRARDRRGLALGAVLAAEWIAGRRGVHGFERVVADIVRGGGKR